MKHLLHLCLLLAVPSLAFAAGDYVLEMGGQSVDLSLGRKETVTLTNGQKLTLLLTKKEIVTFQGESFSFRHKSTFTPTSSALSKHVTQTMMTTATGTGAIVQEYQSIDPSSLIDIMQNELVKDEVRAGYTLEEKPLEKKLADGTVLKGKTITTTAKTSQWIRTVVAHGDGHQGHLMVTFIERENLETDQKFLDLFWQSLALKPMKTLSQ